MLRINKPYIMLEDLLILMTDNSITITNPFAGLNIFNVQGQGYNISDASLWNMFVYQFSKRLVGRPIPHTGKKYIYMNGASVTTQTINTDVDKLNYVWKFLYNNILIFVQKEQDNYYKMVTALTGNYNPIENYNMVELSGSASKVSDTKSIPGKVTSEVGVFPYNANTPGASNSKPESITETSAMQSTAGYVDANQNMRWADGDEFGETPKGNSVAMSKHTRSGNIGVTTTQQMIEQELELRTKSIVEDFLNKCADTCLLAMWR